MAVIVLKHSGASLVKFTVQVPWLELPSLDILGENKVKLSCNTDSLFHLFLTTAKDFVDKKLSTLRQCLENDEEVDLKQLGNVLSYLLVKREMSVKEIYANITEIMLGGIDTVRSYHSYTDADFRSL